MTLQNDDFLNFFQLRRHPRLELFHLSNLLQMSNDHRMVDIEFFYKFLCSSKRISFDYSPQFVVVSFQLPATVLLIFKVLVSFAKLLEPPLHCNLLTVPGPNALLMLCVVSVASQLILSSNKKKNHLSLLFVYHFYSLNTK